MFQKSKESNSNQVAGQNSATLVKMQSPKDNLLDTKQDYNTIKNKIVLSTIVYSKI